MSVQRVNVAALGAAAAAGLVFVAAGWAVGSEDVKPLLAAFALAGLAALWATQRGAYVGVLLLAAMNGLPGYDGSVQVALHLTGQDLASCALIGGAAIWVFLDSETYSSTVIDRRVTAAATALLAWWLLTLVWTIIDQHVPASKAGAYGRDFLFFALLLMVIPRVRFTSAEINVWLGVVTAGVCVFAVGQISTASGLGNLGSLIHYRYTLAQAGLTRVYADMTDLANAALAVSIAASLIATQKWVRRIAPPVALLLAISIAVQLTRARWVGLALGLVLVSLWIASHREGYSSALLRRRLKFVLVAVGIAVAVAVAVAVASPGTFSGGTLVERFFSITSDLQSGGGTVGVREQAAATVLHYLGGQWFLGIGFVPPSSHFFVGLPEGSIRDTDLGVLNGVATMGVIGTILLYLPIVMTLTYCLKQLLARRTQFAWLLYGGAVWIAATLISSTTLVTLFSVSGLTLTSVFISILIQPSVTGAPPNALLNESRSKT